MKLVAAPARTRMGRFLLSDTGEFPGVGEALRRAAFNSALLELITVDGPLPLDGIDEAAAWLEPDAPTPTEPKEFLALLSLAKRVAAVRRRLVDVPDEQAILRGVAEELPDTTGLVSVVSPLLGRDGRIPDDASPELARLRRASGRRRQDLLQVLSRVRRAHGNAVTDAPPTLRRDRYCLPVRSGARSEIPGLLLDTSSSGATAFIEPFEVVEFNNALAETAAKERHELQRILRVIGDAFAGAADELGGAVETLGRLDGSQAAVLFGKAAGGRIVFPVAGAELRLEGARHPLLDGRLRDLRIAEITQMDMKIENGKIAAYRARVKLSFKYGG